MKYHSLGLALSLLLPAALPAQDRPAIEAFGGPEPDERGSTRVLYWDRQKDLGAGEFAIDYGRPVWKKDYEDLAKFDGMTKGKTWRLGKDFWTVLDTNVLLRFSGRDVRVGTYYLGLSRSEHGQQWELAFIDPVRVRKERLDAFNIDKAPIEFKVPMEPEEKGTGTMAEKLVIRFSYSKENPKEVTMSIAWGKLQLKTRVQVVM